LRAVRLHVRVPRRRLYPLEPRLPPQMKM